MLSPNPIGALSFRLAAILICSTCIFYTSAMRSFNKKRLRGRLFLALLILTVIDCVTGVISTIASNSTWPKDVIAVITYVCKYIYYLTHMAFIPVFALYVMIVCDVLHKLNKYTLTLFMLPFILLEIGVITNPFTGFIFRQIDYQYFQRGSGVYIAYAVSMIYVINCLIMLSRYWKSMNRFQKVAMFYFQGLAFIGTVVQMLIPEIVCELMAEALGLMGILIMIERDDDRLDYKTRANNRAALIHDIKNYIEFGRHFFVVCVRIENAESYRRIMGYEVYDFIMSKGADFLSGINYRYETYRTTGGIFFMLCPEATESEMDRIIDVIEDRFTRGFKSNYGTADVKVRVLCGRCPEDFQDLNDILWLGDTIVEDENKIIFRGKDLNFFLRKVGIEKAIVRSMKENSFKVMYQPVYVRENGKVLTAEAVLTLADTVLGDISFDEFMSVADETGLVEELEFRMINSVCDFIKNCVVRDKLELDVIIVHIMSVQILKTDLIDKVKQCLDQYDLDSSRIIFSISDSIAMQAQDILGRIIDEFDEIGIRFALANHGSGLIGLKSDIIDKFIGVSIDVKKHYETTQNNMGDVILRARVDMIRQLEKMVIMSGIDNEKYYLQVKEMPVDLMFGDYLAKCVDRDGLSQMAGTHGILCEKKN